MCATRTAVDSGRCHKQAASMAWFLSMMFGKRGNVLMSSFLWSSCAKTKRERLRATYILNGKLHSCFSFSPTPPSFLQNKTKTADRQESQAQRKITRWLSHSTCSTTMILYVLQVANSLHLSNCILHFSHINWSL